MAINLNNLGVLAAARGEIVEAERCYLRALTIKERVVGPDHPDVAMTAHNLAMLHAEQKRDVEAEAGYQRALRIFTTTLPPDHPKIVTCHEHLAALQSRDLVSNAVTATPEREATKRDVIPVLRC